MNRRRLINTFGIGLFIVFLILVPVFLKNIYWLHVLILSGISILLAVSLRTIHCIGHLSLGHAGFMLLGAYTSSLLVMKAEFSFWTALVLAGFLPAVVAFALGYPFLRVKGIYFALLTLITAETFRSIAWYWGSLTGGPYGLVSIPPPSPITVPGITVIRFDNLNGYYYLTVVIVLLCVLILYELEKSHLGFIWGAIREADNLAESVGINIMWYKTLCFSLGCFFAGIAGALFAHCTHVLIADSASKFGILTNIYIVIYMIVGGEARFAGPVMGAFILTIIPEFARPLREYEPIIFGGLVILVIFFMPAGIVSLPDRLTLCGKKMLKHIMKIG